MANRLYATLIWKHDTTHTQRRGAEFVSHLGRPRFQLNGKINKTENDYTILTKFYPHKI